MAIAKPAVSPIWAESVSSPPDIDVPPYITTGWPAPTAGVSIKPPRGYDNFVKQYCWRGVRYHNSLGLPEWDASENQYQGGKSLVAFGGSHYFLFGTATTGVDPVSDPFNWAPFGARSRPEFGDGTDGDVTISANTQVGDRDRSFNNLTVDATGLLVFIRSFKIRVKGLLWIKAGGAIRFGHETDIHGQNATGAGSGGDGGIGINTYPVGSVGGGSSGGRGGINSAGTHADGALNRAGGPGVALGQNRFGGAGGAGAAGGNVGGAAGTSTVYDNTAIDPIQLAILNGGHGTYRYPTSPPVPATFLLMGGTGGGGGGGPSSLAPPDAAHDGAGGGAGGAVGIILARQIVIEADGALYAPGGNGGNSTSYGGGGGGGGGGIGVVCDSYAGATLTGPVCCPGGTGGTSGIAQPAGSNGGNGLIFVKVL